MGQPHLGMPPAHRCLADAHDLPCHPPRFQVNFMVELSKTLFALGVLLFTVSVHCGPQNAYQGGHTRLACRVR